MKSIVVISFYSSAVHLPSNRLFSSVNLEILCKSVDNYDNHTSPSTCNSASERNLKNCVSAEDVTVLLPDPSMSSLTKPNEPTDKYFHPEKKRFNFSPFASLRIQRFRNFPYLSKHKNMSFEGFSLKKIRVHPRKKNPKNPENPKKIQKNPRIFLRIQSLI